MPEKMVGGRPARPWKVIAEEASREVNVNKMLELIRELNQALDEQGLSRVDWPNDERKSA